MVTKANILIVDDNEVLSGGMKDYLAHEGYAVECANNGKSAITLVQENTYDVAFVDLKLPDIQGTELVKKLTDISSSIEFIHITAHASLDTAIKAVEQEHVVSYEIKPLDMNHLLSVLKQIMKRKQVEDRSKSLAHILEESLNEIYIFDAQTLRFIQANKGARLNLGYSLEELSCLTPVDLRPELTLEHFEKLLEPIRTGKKEKIYFTTVHQRKDGSLYDVEVHLQLSTFQSIPVFVAIILDITKQMQVQKELKELNESLEDRIIERTAEVVKFSHAVEQSSSTVVITDTKGDIEYVNPRFTQTTGYTSEEALGQNPSILKSGEQGAEVYKELWDTITSGSEWRGEFHNKKKNGELYWELASIAPIIDKDGVITSFVAVKEDITERKLMEEELRTFNDLLEQRIAERTSELTNAIEKLQAENTMRMQAEEEVGVSNSYLKLHQIAACSANEAGEIEDGFKPVLSAICHTQGWSIGHAYLLAKGVSDRLIPMKVWHLDDDNKFAAFIKTTEKTNFLSGIGLPGRVLSSGNPEWIVDVTKDSNFPRASIAKEAGIKAGFAFPVMAGSEVVAVLEFFGTDPIEHDNAFLEVMADIGKDLGLIIERKHANEKLRKSEASLLEAQRIARMGSWDWDIVNNTLHWSDEVYRIFDLKPQEFGATYDAFLRSVHPDDRESVKKAANEALYKSVPYNIEHRIDLPDGNERIVHEQAEVNLDENSKPIRMIGTIQDVTDLKKREEELIKAQKLDSIGVLAGGIAHDFNNYLQGISGYIMLAQAYADTDDKVNESLKEAQKIIYQSKELSQRLITFSKGGDPIRQTIVISKLLKDSVLLVTSASSFDCQVGVSEDIWSVEADNGQLGQVFSNIVINAKQAMPNGGKINAFAENIEIYKGTQLPLKEGKYVKVTIKDRGAGISHENLQKIFDPYFTTKKSGSGLGLATCFSIIKKHGGHISVESELGVGTTFCIYLPASVEDIQKMPELSETKIKRGEKALNNDRGKVLLMDDDNAFRAATGNHLRLLKYDVEEAKDGTVAIALYKKAIQLHKPFDAVIMDLQVSNGMGGKEATKELLKIDPEAKVIVASGYIDDSTMSEYKKFGFISALSKPYDIATLDDALQKVIIDN